ncbi:hypothetical protein K1T71_014098 [Dendrolimus kikuchii]|uniref:Uncharacterized protein n=1 Tax=Dendrolimus kikuchii TaxID=765133 RepID=A0ACC1CF92_9NEOP|nr:hypothetical protein K1T71_014098 [Dendrolimus kikuchii]
MSDQSDIEIKSNLKTKKNVQTLSSPTDGLLKKEKKLTTKTMLQEALTSLKSRKGVSLYAIKQYMTITYNFDTDKMGYLLKRQIKAGIEDGTIIQVKGVGVSGSFKLVPTKQNPENIKKKEKKLKKPKKMEIGDGKTSKLTESSGKAKPKGLKSKKTAEKAGKETKTSKEKVVEVLMKKTTKPSKITKKTEENAESLKEVKKSIKMANKDKVVTLEVKKLKNKMASIKKTPAKKKALIRVKYCKMQQPMVQSDQLGNQQQITQQMVLCPVRVVYETQILIPPGEQIQPNQTIFINPQNPPPWVQNRLQNQVLYVQQMPNIVPQIQQNIDQNQMYLQQNYSYQIPQMLTQERPMQIQNNFQNIATNITGNPNERLYMSNIGQIPNQMKQQNVQMLNNQIDMQRFLRPQVNQSYRPQVMINPTQNLQNLPQINVPNTQVTNTNIGNVPTSNINVNILPNSPMSSSTVAINNTNIGQIQPRLQPVPNIRPVQQPSKVASTIIDNNAMSTATIGATVPNRLPVQQATKIGNMVFEHSTNNVNYISNAVSRVQPQAYRPIQPRPQYRTNIPSVQTVAPVQNLPYYNQKPNQIQNYNVGNSRKRKSESPDDSKQKIVAFESNVQTPNIISIKTSNEIGVNTSPIHKMEDRVPNCVPQFKIADHVSQKIVPDVNFPKNNSENIKNLPINTNTSVVESEKLVRNTVYTQARGRLLNDKEIKTNEPMSVSNEHIINVLNGTVTRQYTNNIINHTTIKDNINLASITASVSQNERLPNQNDTPTAFTARSMPIIENIAINDSKSFDNKQTQVTDRSEPNVYKNELNKNTDVMNNKLEGNARANINKAANITSNDINKSFNNETQTEPKNIINNSRNFNNTQTQDNNSALRDALIAKIEENNSKINANERQLNSMDNKDIKNTSNVKKSLINKNSLENNQNLEKKDTTNANASNISIVDSKFSPNNVKQINDENVKLKACKVQLNSNEIQLNAGQIKQVQLNSGNDKIQLKDGKSQLNDDKIQLNDGKPQLDDDKIQLHDIIDTNKVKEERMMDKIVFKQEAYDHDILTHVLDGYVIQESNVAFPIRRPMREKIIYNQQTDGQTKDNEMKAPVDLPLLPFYYMHLKNEVVKEEKGEETAKDDSIKEKLEAKVDKVKEDEKDKTGHAFSNLQQSAVKTWTVDQLIKHLYDQDWTETASILQEHEIDGESLFLVSKSQLLHIGIGEEHADVICDFVHS